MGPEDELARGALAAVVATGPEALPEAPLPTSSLGLSAAAGAGAAAAVPSDGAAADRFAAASLARRARRWSAGPSGF